MLVLARRALSTARWLHTGALRTSIPRMNETVREVEQAHKTYFRQKAGDSAGFRRARKPYRLVNWLSMLAICTFAGGVYAYSILMVCIKVC